MGQRYNEALQSTLLPVMQQLAQQKFMDMAQRQVAAQRESGLAALFPNMSKEQIHGLSLQPESTINQVLKYEQQRPMFEALGSLATGLPMGEQGIGSITNQQQYFQPTEMPEQQVENENIVGPYTPLPGKEKAKTVTAAQRLPGKAPMLTPQMANMIQKERLAKEKLLAHKEELSEKQRVEAFKLTKDERRQILQEAQQADRDLRDLDRFEELMSEGKTDTPGYVEFLKRSGLDIPTLMSPGSQEWEKLASSFIRGAKDTFGARVTNFDLENFLKSIPSLSQSPEGQKRVIAGLKQVKRAQRERAETLKSVMRENKGIPPLDMLEQIDDRMAPKLDKIAKQFKTDLAKPVPEGQSKIMTALGAITGSVLGAPGALIHKAGSAASSLASLI